MSTFDWAGRSDQFAKIKTFLPVLAPFVKKPMDQVNLLQIVQTYCYDEQKVMKSFPNIVRVLWDAELVSVCVDSFSPVPVPPRAELIWLDLTRRL
jgi:hypothetical protein